MQPLVQSAIDAANRGENNKALEFLKQALAANPNDVDAWLVVAAVVEQPERKRQCLNRVLYAGPHQPDRPRRTARHGPRRDGRHTSLHPGA